MQDHPAGSRLYLQMPRLPRVVIPGLAHHVTQRGNRRQPAFLRDYDYELYRQLLAEHCARERVAVWAYSQLPNHVHLILVPTDPDGLRRVLSLTHQRYTSRINRREGWKGCLWQGRFSSFPMDERHLYAAARYVLLNPVRAGLVTGAQQWKHSSLQAHLAGKSDGLVDVQGLATRISDWAAFLAVAPDWNDRTRIRRHESSGLPLGDEEFLRDLEDLSGRRLLPESGRAGLEVAASR